jgi:hypothetical protein
MSLMDDVRQDRAADWAWRKTWEPLKTPYEFGKGKQGEIMKFRKKPVVIEAEQFIERNGNRLPFVEGHRRGPLYFRDGRWWVNTLEGPLCVSNGDWIIKGVKGEFYPCKPDIFEQTYERVEE